MLHKQRFFFLASSAIAIALSCVYGRSLFTGYLTNVINPTVVVSGSSRNTMLYDIIIGGKVVHVFLKDLGGDADTVWLLRVRLGGRRRCVRVLKVLISGIIRPPAPRDIGSSRLPSL